MQFFIGNGSAYPHTPDREAAVQGAHITHMLRDLREDVPMGIINLPQEWIPQHGELDMESALVRQWAQSQVALARADFKRGKAYIRSLPVLRCQLAGMLYCARFESLLDVIERDNFVLRVDYSHARSAWTGIQCVFLCMQTIAQFWIRKMTEIVSQWETYFVDWNKKNHGAKQTRSVRYS
jgi:hypothetical protein